MSFRPEKPVLKFLVFSVLPGLTQVSLAEVAAPGNYRIDPEHARVIFSVDHLATSELE